MNIALLYKDQIICYVNGEIFEVSQIDNNKLWYVFYITTYNNTINAKYIISLNKIITDNCILNCGEYTLTSAKYTELEFALTPKTDEHQCIFDILKNVKWMILKTNWNYYVIINLLNTYKYYFCALIIGICILLIYNTLFIYSNNNIIIKEIISKLI